MEMTAIMTSQIDMWVAFILTIGAVLANYAACVYAIKVGLELNGCPWLTLRGERQLAMQILLGGILVCFYLGGMKLWSATHIFLLKWHSLPPSYHVEAFMYLFENYAVAVLTWKYTIYMKRLTANVRPEDAEWLIIKDCQNDACISRGSCISNKED